MPLVYKSNNQIYEVYLFYWLIVWIFKCLVVENVNFKTMPKSAIVYNAITEKKLSYDRQWFTGN